MTRMNHMTRHLSLLLLIAICGWMPVGIAQADTVTYYHPDALGTPVMESNASGLVTYTREHRPYGEQTLGAVKIGPGFTGHVGDADTGLTYMQARYYDPVAGRFLSNDPVAADLNTGANFNRYWYANNNPNKFTDPDGRQSKKEEPCKTMDCNRARQDERRRRSDAPFTGGSPRRAEYSGKALDTRLGAYANPDEVGKVVDSHSSGKQATDVTQESWTGARYIYTEQFGWVDLKHVTVSAMIKYGDGFGTGLIWELGQKFAYPTSAFAVEDLNSNFIGSILSMRKTVHGDERSLGELAQSLILRYRPMTHEKAVKTLRESGE